MVFIVHAGSGAPETYEELVTSWSQYIRGVMLSGGVPAQDADDAVQDTLLAFWLRGGLEKYDASLVWDTARDGTAQRVPGPRYRTARFASYLRQFAVLYARGRRDKAIRLQRAVLVEDLPTRSSGVDVSASVVARLDAARVLEEARRLASDPRRSSPRGYWSMDEVLTVLEESVAAYGAVNHKFVAAALEISVGAVPGLLQKVRVLFEDAGYQTSCA